MNAWAQSLPIVTAPLGDTPKPVTLVLPYYECPTFFARQYEALAALPSELAHHLSVIVVDDGSPDHPLVLKQSAGRRRPSLRAFRIDVDVPWNWLAARNIGAQHAADGWILFTDMDHVVPQATWSSIVFGRHDPHVIYALSRREHTGAAIPPHSASFVMTREMFWRVGGYDEALSGHYGTDGDWRRRCAAVAPMCVLTDVLIRHEYVADSSTMRYVRKHPDDLAAVRRLVQARHAGWAPKTLSFPYHELPT